MYQHFSALEQAGKYQNAFAEIDPLEWDPRPSVCVVMASEGYPGSYEKGKPIRGLAEAAALEMARHMNLGNPEVISRRIMHPAEGSLFEVKGRLDMAVRTDLLPTPKGETLLPEAEIEAWARRVGWIS